MKLSDHSSTDKFKSGSIDEFSLSKNFFVKNHSITGNLVKLINVFRNSSDRISSISRLLLLTRLEKCAEPISLGCP